MTQQEVLDSIARGDFDADLNTLINAVTTAVVARFKYRDHQPLAIGSRVFFNGYTGRKSSQGAVGTLVQVNRTRVVVELDEPEYRNGRPVARVTCPLTILDPLPENAEVLAGFYLPSLAH